MAETHELRLKIDAGAARAGAKQFTGAIESVRRAVRDLERDSTGAFIKLRNMSPKVDVSGLKAASREANNVAKAQGQAERASERAAAEMKRVALSSASAMRTSQNEVQRLTERFAALGSTDAIDRLNRDLMTMKQALTSAQSGLDVRAARSNFADSSAELKRLANDLEAEQRAHRRAADAATDHAREMDRLRAKYNPLYSASKAYESSLEEIAQAEQAGVLSANMATQARERAAAQLGAASAAADQYTASLQRNAAMTQQGIMAGHQFQDILIQAQMGFASVGQIAIMQGSQLASQMNSIKATGGSVFRTLLSGFASLLNPVTAVTLAVVAVGTAVAKWFFSASEDTKSFSDSLSDAHTSIQNLRNATDALAGRNLADLRDRYGEVNDQLDAHLERLQKVATLEAAVANADMMASIRDALTSDGNPFTGEVDAVRRAFETTNDQARHLLGLMDRVRSARTFESQAQAVTTLREAIEDTGVNLDSAEGAAARMLIQLVKAEDAALMLKAAQDGTSSATDRATGAASNLTYTIGTAADEAARLLANLNSVPSALAVMGKSVQGQIASMQAQNKALNLQIGEGLSSVAANRRVQLETMVSTAGERGQSINFDQIAKEYQAIEELDALAKKQKDLRDTLSEMNRPTRKASGGRKAALSEEAKAMEDLNDSLQGRLDGLRQENLALQLVANGTVESTEAAQALAEAQLATGGAVDANTLAMVKQIDVAARLNKELTKVANDPVKKWRESVPTWKEAATEIEMGAINHVRDAISEMIKTGKFDIEALGDAILGTIADIVADKAVKELHTLLGGDDSSNGGLLGGLFGSFDSVGDPATAQTGQAVSQGGMQAGQHISNAMMQAGQTVSQQISQAMTQGGQMTGQQVQQAHAMGGQQAANATRLAGVQHGQHVRLATTTGGNQHATRVKTAIETGGREHASMVRSAASGSTGTGGFLDFLGGPQGLLGMAIGAFDEGGYSTAPANFTNAPVSAFRHAPHFAEGTPNTSGIPAVLHDNEAVVPLSKGRKIPVEMGESAGAGGGQTISYNPTYNISTPDVGGFRKSQKQVTAEGFSAAQRAANANN
ncbi:MAG: phage tail tape measure C-terminal domain-containing protein [Roseovarius sp.]